MVKVTVFTPSYNRASLLNGLCESLLRQTFHNFEWIVVDDGSSDNTRQLMTDLIRKANFPVHYYYKDNGGKHTAVNMGVRLAKGELFLILDSDDELPTDSLDTIYKAYGKIRVRKDIGGVCGYMAHRNGEVIGHPQVEGEMNSLEIRFQHHVSGDMCEVFRTDVLKEFPFPEIPGERFCPEMLVWNRIAQKYKLFVFPEVIYLRDYLDGGLTDNIVRIRMQSPVASMMTYQEMTTYDVPFKTKVRAAINYYRFKGCLSKKHAHDEGGSIPALSGFWFFAKPIGWLMHQRDISKENKR